MRRIGLISVMVEEGGIGVHVLDVFAATAVDVRVHLRLVLRKKARSCFDG